mmetsp:Transcript_140730/g.245132  ORF Transcript_140730/g.245132 Transcript_140730/m.245132 type:complete len:306 (-) Transcript_140730:2240-3157(-)
MTLLLGDQGVQLADSQRVCLPHLGLGGCKRCRGHDQIVIEIMPVVRPIQLSIQLRVQIVVLHHGGLWEVHRGGAQPQCNASNLSLVRNHTPGLFLLLLDWDAHLHLVSKEVDKDRGLLPRDQVHDIHARETGVVNVLWPQEPLHHLLLERLRLGAAVDSSRQNPHQQGGALPLLALLGFPAGSQRENQFIGFVWDAIQRYARLSNELWVRRVLEHLRNPRPFLEVLTSDVPFEGFVPVRGRCILLDPTHRLVRTLSHRHPHKEISWSTTARRLPKDDHQQLLLLTGIGQPNSHTGSRGGCRCRSG